jgi:hypothetical protein
LKTDRRSNNSSSSSPEELPAPCPCFPTFFFALVFTCTSDKFSITFAVVVVAPRVLLALAFLVVVFVVALFLPAVKDDDGFEDDFFSDDDDDVAPSSSSAADALAMETRLVVLFAVKQTPPNPVFLGKIEEINRDDMVRDDYLSWDQCYCSFDQQ